MDSLDSLSLFQFLKIFTHMEYHTNTVKSLDLLGNEVVFNAERIGKTFLQFINEYKTTHKSYFHQLHANLTQNIHHLPIHLEHIGQFSDELFSALSRDPENVLEVFERAICKEYSISNFQIQLISSGQCTKIRNISASKSNKIVKIQGIVVSCTSVITKPKELFLTCRNCLSTKMTRDAIPRSCEKANCPIDPYVVIPEKSIVSDVQYAKLQEDFEDIPVGETPRHFSIMLEGDLVDKIVPGTLVEVTGIYIIKNSGEKGISFIKVLGIEGTQSKTKHTFTEEEELYFKNLSKTGIYERISNSIAPSIYGHRDIKKALACMLFGGTRRVREDGITLRGDINILLLGDPGIAKSQLLKFIEKVSPVGIYTSGKSSSAAGLTASVLRDKQNNWVLEGGALVLADNGVCCIDEFDKMNANDRVSIHEAMEQQTISIAKAGITTVLNTRTSILAAANPVFGRYDDYKTPADNIEFGSTILSRFDCIFIIKDVSGPGDKILADFVVGLHVNNNTHNDNDICNENLDNTQNSTNDSTSVPDILPIRVLTSYIQYAKSRITPTLSQEASAKLSKFYVSIRQEVKAMEVNGKKGPIPITVRQLEAIVRISESLAKMELGSIVDVGHVDEAIRLFQLSTMSAVSQGHMIEGMMRPSFFDEINEVILKIKDCIPIGASKKFSDVVKIVGCKDSILKSTVDYMVKQNKMITKDYGRTLVRLP